MASLPSVLTPCLNDAVSRCGPMLDRAIEHALNAIEEEMRQLPSQRARQDHSCAFRAMAMERGSFRVRFPEALQEALNKPALSKPSVMAMRPSSLTLVDDAEVMQSIESSRLAQELRNIAEQPLAELDALMSSALGLDTIHAEQNPLRPEIFAQALRTVLVQAAEEPGWPALWMRHMARPLGDDLITVYRSAAKLLRQARVEAAGYRLVTSPAPLTPATSTTQRNTSAGPSSRAGALHPGGAPSGGGNSISAHTGSAHSGGGHSGSRHHAGNTSHGGGAHSGGGHSGGGHHAGNTSRGGGASRPAPLDGGPAAARDGQPQPGALWRGVSGIADLITQVLRGPLFSDFLSRGSAQAKQALAPDYFVRVDEELAALEARRDEPPAEPEPARRYAHLPVVERPMREVGPESPLNREVWGALGAPRQRSLVRTRLKQQAQNVGQVMGLEVVRELVGQVARDPRLLAPVREAIVALEPSLARLALQAPRFFGEEQHPARQLVERVAERSFRYNDEFASQFQEFFGEISSRFNALNREDALQDEQPFAEALTQLETTWAEQDKLEEAQRQEMVEALKFAEARQAEAGQIAWTLSQRSDLQGAPAAVQDFIFGRWALVMAHARLRNGGRDIDPGEYGALVTDLLWSVKRDTVLRDPAHAFELIPRLVAKLRQGLDLLGDAPREDETFFKALERLHRPVLKLRAMHRRQAFEVPSELPSEADLPRDTVVVPPKPEELWLAPREQRDVGFQDTVAGDPVEMARAAAQLETEQSAAQPDALPPSQADVLLASLQVGCWVDLFARRQWRRAQLTWASGNAALFMFVSQGGLAHSMTKRSLHRLLVDRLVRPVEGHAVVQRAIEQLAQAQPQPQAQLQPPTNAQPQPHQVRLAA